MILFFRPIRQTVSCDTPMSATSTPQRTLSCETSEANRCSTDEHQHLPPGISSSSSEHDNHEQNAWSSDYSNSEDEFTHFEDGVTPVSYSLLFF